MADESITLRSGVWRVFRIGVAATASEVHPEERIFLHLEASRTSKIRLLDSLPAGAALGDVTHLARRRSVRSIEVDGVLWECLPAGSPEDFILQEKKTGRPQGSGRLPVGITLLGAKDEELAVAVRRVVHI